MSYTNGTPFLNLPQTIGSDHRDWFDTNEAFLNMDGKFKTLWDDSGSAASAIAALQELTATLQTDLASLEGTVDTHTSALSTINEALVLINGTLATLNTSVATKFDSAGIADPYDAAHGIYAVGDVVTYNGQRYVCSTAVTAAEPFDADKWTAEDVQSVIENLFDSVKPVDLTPIWYSVHYTNRKIWLYRIGKIVYYNIATTTDEARSAGPIVEIANNVSGVNGIKIDQSGSTQAQRGFMNIVRSGSNIVRECYVSLDTVNNRIDINSEVALENGDIVTLTGYFRTN